MKKKTVIEMNMDDVLPLRIYHFEDGGEGRAVDINYGNMDEMTKELKCSKELLFTLLAFGGDITEVFKGIKKDMIDLYMKLDS